MSPKIQGQKSILSVVPDVIATVSVAITVEGPSNITEVRTARLISPAIMITARYVDITGSASS